MHTSEILLLEFRSFNNLPFSSVKFKATLESISKSCVRRSGYNMDFVTRSRSNTVDFTVGRLFRGHRLVRQSLCVYMSGREMVDVKIWQVWRKSHLLNSRSQERFDLDKLAIILLRQT